MKTTNKNTRLFERHLACISRLLLAGAVLLALPATSLAQYTGIGAFFSNGLPDTLFSADGRAIINGVGAHVGENEDPDSIGSRIIARLDGQGRLVVVGRVAGGGISLTRYGLDGAVQLQQTRTFNCGVAEDEVRGMTIRLNRIIVVGTFCNGWGIAAFTEDFNWDTTFNTYGRILEPNNNWWIPFGTGMTLSTNSEPNDVVVDANYRIVVVGTAYHYPEGTYRDSAIVVTAYYWTGPHLSTSVVNIYDPAKDSRYRQDHFETPESVKMQGTRIVLAGHLNLLKDGTSDFMLGRYVWHTSSLGGPSYLVPSTTFGNDLAVGYRIIEFGNGYEAEAYSVDVDTLNRIVAAGAVIRSTGNRYFAIARLTSEGALDTSFDGDGRVTMTFGWADSEARAVLVDRYNRVVAGGWTRTPSPGYTKKFALARLTSSGLPDQSFGTGTGGMTSWGRVVADLTCNSGEEIRSMDLDERFAESGYRLYAVGGTEKSRTYCITAQ